MFGRVQSQGKDAEKNKISTSREIVVFGGAYVWLLGHNTIFSLLLLLGQWLENNYRWWREEEKGPELLFHSVYAPPAGASETCSFQMELLNSWPKFLPAQQGLALLCGENSRWCQSQKLMHGPLRGRNRSSEGMQGKGGQLKPKYCSCLGHYSHIQELDLKTEDTLSLLSS